jgi:glycosyltransferase involved in cell wall biosynthesis
MKGTLMTTLFDINPDWIGGTELMALAMEKNILPEIPELAEWNWILAPGKINLREDGKNIAWVHLGEFEGDLSWLCDPLVEHVIFVSYYQFQRFTEMYPNLDQSKCHVIKNAIDPIVPQYETNKDKIKLVFHPEPYRGLDILLMAFNLLKDLPDLELHIFGDMDSSTIEWEQKAKDRIKYLSLEDHRIEFHGRASNQEIRDFLPTADIFAYPSKWRETSCLALIEAMCAGLNCITNSFTVLPETGIGLTTIYPFTYVDQDQAKMLAMLIRDAVEQSRSDSIKKELQTAIANEYYSWETRLKDWQDFYKYKLAKDARD